MDDLFRFHSVFIEYKMKLLLIKQGWFLIYTTIEIFAAYFYVIMLVSYLEVKGIKDPFEFTQSVSRK